MAMPRRSPGNFREIPARTLLCTIVCRLAKVNVWFSFRPGFGYSSNHLPTLYSYLLKCSLAGTYDIAEDLFAFSYFAISLDRSTKSTRWEQHATLKASDCGREAPSVQVRVRTECRWLR